MEGGKSSLSGGELGLYLDDYQSVRYASRRFDMLGLGQYIVDNSSILRQFLFMGPDTLREAILYFASPDNCREFLVAHRWADGVTCPRRGGKNVLLQAKYKR